MVYHVIDGKEYIAMRDFKVFVSAFSRAIINDLNISKDNVKEPLREVMGFSQRKPSHKGNSKEDNMDKYYLITTLVKAEPEKAQTDMGNHKIGDDGYKIIYPDGYVSWSPKDVFEASYMKVTPNSHLKTDKPSISQQMVDDFIAETHVETIGDKTTVVRAVLANGFEIIESSSCVSAENYDEELGAKICMNKIKDKVWYLLGFLLQTAVVVNAKVVKVNAPTELSDTVKLMNSDKYTDRFMAEYYQTKIRLDKLKAMVEKWDNNELNFEPTCSREMYDDQIEAMERYLSILKDRASLEHVTVVEEDV